MGISEYKGLKEKLCELAMMIAAAKPGVLRFRSENEFLRMVSLQPVYIEQPVTSTELRRRD